MRKPKKHNTDLLLLTVGRIYNAILWGIKTKTKTTNKKDDVKDL